MSLRAAAPPAVDYPPAPTIPGITPPPPSGYYLQDRTYREHNDLDRGTVSRAFTDHAQWAQRHSEATAVAQEWLATVGLLGEPAQEALAAFRAQTRSPPRPRPTWAKLVSA